MRPSVNPKRSKFLPLPPQARLLELFTCDPLTGGWDNRITRGQSRQARAGEPAGSWKLDKKKTFAASRLGRPQALLHVASDLEVRLRRRPTSTGGSLRPGRHQREARQPAGHYAQQGCAYYEKTVCPRRHLPRCQSKLLKGGIGAGARAVRVLEDRPQHSGRRLEDVGLLNDLGQARWRLVLITADNVGYLIKDIPESIEEPAPRPKRAYTRRTPPIDTPS
jgi:hypothetical protein